ncbi:flagellar export chaperone FliS [Shewanella electrodiphila]|uniref:Flagellar secretion chaperone FliS n=1 Tax=Shewanella electrodiphila TaxID=934143 RepID=A0ABT0KMJ4_9GAMM|nr:flagellar export chaperone FliS [Shewanella electrodiphila]MCL1044819.1 flagellar export chaperone FliS [Shewanella electrodiphila]
MRGSIKSYRKVSIDSELAVASPHRIIQMMFDGALLRLAQSRYAIETQDLQGKGVAINKAIGIINGLNNSLNMDVKDSVAGNLSELYDFMLRRISEANMNNDVKAIDDVSGILRTIKEGWDAIPQDMHLMTSEAS